MQSDRLTDKKIVIATHVYATGPSHDLRDYLKSKKTGKLLFIGYPLFYDKHIKGSGYEFYKEGKEYLISYSQHKKNPEILNYFRDICMTIFWTIKFGKSWDVFIGVDNLNALSGIILQKLGFVKKTVYYVIDYDPQKYPNKLMNAIYQWIDLFCTEHATETWNLSERMKEGRKKYFNFSKGNQKTVPIGIWFARIKRLPLSKVQKHTLVFMGHVIEKQGIQFVLAAFKTIKKQIPDFKFLIIGGGDYLDILRSTAKKLQITDDVTFTGFVEKHEDVENLLTRCACAIAPYLMYEGNKINRTYFADPGKIKSYLATGLPILITDVPHNAKDVEKNKCGIIISLDSVSIAKAVVMLLNDQKQLETYRNNAVLYAKKYDWEKVFEKALGDLV